MIAKVKFKIDNKIYNITVKLVDSDEIIINIKTLKESIAEKLIINAYILNNIKDVVYHNAIKNTIINAIEIVSVTIPNYDKTK